MFKVYGFLDDQKVMEVEMAHLPRNGDKLRLFGEKYGIVTEVIWCMDVVRLDKAQVINLQIKSVEYGLAPQK